MLSRFPSDSLSIALLQALESSNEGSPYNEALMGIARFAQRLPDRAGKYCVLVMCASYSKSHTLIVLICQTYIPSVVVKSHGWVLGFYLRYDR